MDFGISVIVGPLTFDLARVDDVLISTRDLHVNI